MASPVLKDGTAVTEGLRLLSPGERQTDSPPGHELCPHVLCWVQLFLTLKTPLHYILGIFFFVLWCILVIVTKQQQKLLFLGKKKKENGAFTSSESSICSR